MRKDLAFWSAHLAAIKHAQMSVSAYARRHGIAVKSLYYWQRKVRLAAVPAVVIAPKAFVAVRVNEPVAVCAPMGCVLVLTCGMRLEMSALPSPAWLIALGRSEQGGL